MAASQSRPSQYEIPPQTRKRLILDGKVYAGVTNKTYMYLWPIDKNSQSSKVILTPRCEIGNGDGMAMSMILGMHQAIWEQGGRVEISATNSYTGDTFLHGAITVLYTDAPVGQNGAFGNASSVVKIGGITPGLANGLYANCTATLLTGVAGLTVGRDLHVYYGNANNTTFGVIIGGEHTSGTSTFSGKLRLAVNTSWPRTTDVQVVSAAGGTVRLTGEIEDYVAGGGPAIKKIGLGTVLLSGASAYRGGTKVSQGTLLVNGTLGTGAVTVASAATLGGTGTIRGWVAAQTGSYLAPGDNGIGTLTVSNLTFAADSTYRWEGHSAGGDRINALVGATLPTAMTVTVSRLDSSELTSAAVLIDSATPIGGGNPANFTLVPAATYTLGLSGDGKQLLLRPPPKGSAILIL